MSAVGWSNPIVGVIGGLGPAATVTFLDQLVRLSDAATDQDNVDAIVSQHSSTPDRSSYILSPATQPDPTPILVADAQRLERAGADLLVSPCNTIQYFWEAIEAAVAIPCLSIIDVTASQAAQVSAHGKVAVFATEGTVKARLYQAALERLGCQPLVPSPAVQDALTDIIHLVKAGLPVDIEVFNGYISQAQDDGAEAVIMGCTELSVVYDQYGMDKRPELVDSLRSLVVATIKAAGLRVRG
jgi:aspartate racemase